MQDFNVTFRYAIQRECTLEWRGKQDRINYNNLVFILKGKALYKIDGNEQILTENQVLLIPAGSLREAERFVEESLTLQSFDFFSDQPLPALPQSVLTLDSLDFYLPLFQDFNRHWLTEKPLSRLHCKALFYQILDELYQTAWAMQENPHVRQMKTYIESHLTQNITMEDLAWVSGLNVVYCGALFKQETGVTALRYWRILQIRKATQLLSEPDISVSEAAWQSGFDDLFYFSKLFKEIQGVSPKVYQRRHAGSVKLKENYQSNHG